MTSGWLGRKEEGDQANDVPRMIRERAKGLDKGGRAGTKGKHSPYIIIRPDSAASGCRGGNGGSRPLGSSVRSPGEAGAQASATLWAVPP